jgi:hypothetical protein
MTTKKSSKKSPRVLKGEPLGKRKPKKSEKVGRSWIAKAKKGDRGKKEKQREVPEGKKAWSEEVAERLAKRMALEANMTAEQYAEYRKGKCSALTSGVYGPVRPCDRLAIKGGTVCQIHGGSAKQTKEAARKRIMEEVFPTIDRLTQIRDQDGHMPSALGASKELLNRAMGKPEATQGQLGAGAPIILIGERLGALPVQVIEANRQKQLVEAGEKSDEDVIEGELAASKDDDDFADPFDE